MIIVECNQIVQLLELAVDHEMRAYGGFIFLLFMDSLNGWNVIQCIEATTLGQVMETHGTR